MSNKTHKGVTAEDRDCSGSGGGKDGREIVRAQISDFDEANKRRQIKSAFSHCDLIISLSLAFCYVQQESSADSMVGSNSNIGLGIWQILFAYNPHAQREHKNPSEIGADFHDRTSAAQVLCIFEIHHVFAAFVISGWADSLRVEQWEVAVQVVALFESGQTFLRHFSGNSQISG